MSDSGELGGKLLMLGNVSGTVLNGTLYANERSLYFIRILYKFFIAAANHKGPRGAYSTKARIK